MIERFSSRRASLAGFLPARLRGARAYDRIAGYFSASILEVAGEAIDEMAEGAVARVLCNSHLDPLDVAAARAARQAMYQEWCVSLPEDIGPALKRRLDRLNRFLASGRLKVRVLPDEHFGLIHGKAGVVTAGDGGQVAFLGSANESKSGWQRNYELVWTDDSPASVAWVQEEFDALWGHPAAVDLADAVIEDTGRLSRREVLNTVQDWKDKTGSAPASPAVELPVYRRENGLWAHQKFFVRLAFEQHKEYGARLVLADQVGLGKTVQLALAAKLMALWGEGPVLALVPKPLLQQWQDELWDLLRLPSAVWTGRCWRDEQGLLYPERGLEELRRCPRRVGLVSTGLVVQAGAAARILEQQSYECVILDEAHRARRRNLGPTHLMERAEPNNLLRFLRAVAKRTRSLLLATATPVQVDPIEAWDLLDALNEGNRRVLGSEFSQWAREPRQGLAYVTGHEPPPDDVGAVWAWVRDPFPPADEDRTFAALRSRLELDPTTLWARPDALDGLPLPDRQRVERLRRTFFQSHNPFIRHIVRRTREFLEDTIDPQTNEPYLRPVRVRLFGERREEAVPLPTFLSDAYAAAEAFCELLKKRPGLSAGFIKTLLLRRVGSTIAAARRTAMKMLGDSPDLDEDETEEGEEATARDAATPAVVAAAPPRPAPVVSALYPLSADEREKLDRFLALLEANKEEDPKRREVERLLLQGTAGTGPWLEQGCIIFSQYFDSVYWLAERLSERLPDETVAIYAGSGRSGVLRAGAFTRLDRESIKTGVREGTLRLVVGTDAASEGLNLQRLGTLINLDLPWNPTRLEQRKGRIQRIGQVRDEVLLYNMRYRGSVEDRVHELLSDRLETIRDMFGQLPDTLEDVWVHVALHDEEQARQVIDQVPPVHPFELRYDRIEPVDWESCSVVLDAHSQLQALMRGW